MEDLYREELLDLYKHPHNFGELDQPSCRINEVNASCGDMLTLDISVNNGKISDVKFKGVGCAISMAAASKLTDYIKGKSIKELQEINFDFMQELIGTAISPGRVKCLTLSAKALMKALNQTIVKG